MQEKLNTDELLQKLERLSRENERLKSIAAKMRGWKAYSQHMALATNKILRLKTRRSLLYAPTLIIKACWAKSKSCNNGRISFEVCSKVGRMCLHSDGPAAMVASPVTCRHAPTVGLLFVIEKNTNAPTVRTANLLLWVTQKFIITCVAWISGGSLLQ